MGAMAYDSADVQAPCRRSRQAVCSVSPYRLRISLIGWCQVSPPLLQLPQPPEVTPCAWSPLMNEPPESPGSAHTLVLVI